VVRAFFAGSAVGLVVGFAVAWFMPREGPRDEAAPTRVERPAAPSEAPVLVGPTPTPTASEPAVAGAPTAGAPFLPGTATLAIGDGYVFGEDRARPGADPESVDVSCQDIHHGVSLRCAHGAVAADVPLAAVGMPAEAGVAASLVKDAPRELPQRNAKLASVPMPRASGIALVRSAAGKTYRVHLVAEHGSPSALERRAEIAWKEVPSVEGGGVIRLPTTSRVGSERTHADLRRLYDVGRAIPGDSFASHLLGDYERPSDLPPHLDVRESKHLLIESPLASTIRLGGGGAVFAAAGIAREGKVVLDSYAAVAVHGDLDGKVEVRSYAYVHVSGDLTGEVDVGSYATVVIDGDIRGTLRVRSYTDLLLRGRILGALETKGSCWCDFWFESYFGRSDLEALPGPFGSVTLHLLRTDLPPGKHEKVGTWREVIVGEPVWDKLRRRD
jgi:hypothetical protein